MESLLQGIPKVAVQMTGKTRQDHLKHLRDVLAQLDKAAIHLKVMNCVFLQEEMVYLGHCINQSGIHRWKAK